MRYLKATLAAPLASFGGPAASGMRKDGGAPQRSAVIGLVCACLGIDRAGNERMREVSARLGVLVRMDRPGDPLTDFHTTQFPKEAAVNAWAREHGGSIPTRRTLLDHAKALGKLDTSLSEREYRTDVVLTLLLWDRHEGEGPGFLDGIAAAMVSPAFTPTLGRRACPLSLPMFPWFVEADDVVEALRADRDEAPREQGRNGQRQRLAMTRAEFMDRALNAGRLMKDRPAMCHTDMDARVGGSVTRPVLSYRRDEPRDRAGWLFSERREMAFPMPEGA